MPLVLHQLNRPQILGSQERLEEIPAPIVAVALFGEIDVIRKLPQINHPGGSRDRGDQKQGTEGAKNSFHGEHLTAGRTNYIINLSVCSSPGPKCKHSPLAMAQEHYKKHPIHSYINVSSHYIWYFDN